LGTPRKHGIWSITTLIQSHAIGTSKAALSRRLIGLDMMPLPAQSLRTIGARVKMNANASSHMKANKTIGKFFGKLPVFTSSRAINGSTKSAPATADSLRFDATLIMAPSLVD
jgi:hypothetical protein